MSLACYFMFTAGGCRFIPVAWFGDVRLVRGREDQRDLEKAVGTVNAYTPCDHLSVSTGRWGL